MTLNEIRSRADRLGLDVETSAPGDGMRRYRFFLIGGGGHLVGGAAGAREAELFLLGFEAAIRLWEDAEAEEERGL